MPIFEYRCKGCEGQFEMLVRSSGSEGVSCPSCSSGEVTRLFSTFASKGSTAAQAASAPAPRPSGGGCGTSCGCH